MKRISTKLASSILLVLGTCAGGLAHADTTYTYTYGYQWSVGSNCSGGWISNYGGCGLTGGNRTLVGSTPGAPADPNLPAASITSTATGWSNTNGTNTASNASAQTIEEASLQAWNNGSGVYGLGVGNQDNTSLSVPGSRDSTSETADGNEGLSTAPAEHTVDNNDRYDSILYSFNNAVALSSASISFVDTDSDIVVLAYNAARGGAFSLASDLKGLTYSQLAAAGWDYIGDYGNLAVGENRAINAGKASSSYWLIGTANSLIGNVNDSKLDYVKLASLGATATTSFTKHDTPPVVPEPGSLALLGLGSLLLVRARSKKS